MELTEIKKIIETLLFVVHKPLTLETLKEVTGFEEEAIRQGLDILEEEHRGRGLQIIRRAFGWEMCTRFEYADYVQKLLSQPAEVTLTKSAMETLAIVAYKQPVTRSEVNQIRGVMSDSPIETLLTRELIKEVGRRETVGRPMIYGTTDEFLHHFGLQDLNELKDKNLWNEK